MDVIPEEPPIGLAVPRPAPDVTRLHQLTSPHKKGDEKATSPKKVPPEVSLDNITTPDEDHAASPTYMTPRTSPAQRKSPEGMSVDPDANLSTDEPSSVSMRAFPSLHHYPVHTGVSHSLFCAVARCVGVPNDQVEMFVDSMIPTIVPDRDDEDLHLLSFQLDLNPVFRHTQEVPFFNARPEAIRYNHQGDQEKNGLSMSCGTSL
jgi:hypothetical protein